MRNLWRFTLMELFRLQEQHVLPFCSVNYPKSRRKHIYTYVHTQEERSIDLLTPTFLLSNSISKFSHH